MSGQVCVAEAHPANARVRFDPEGRTYTAPMGEPGIQGFELLVEKRSAVDANGALRQDPIDGLRFRPTRPVPHEDGTVAEVARAAWPEIDLPVLQVHITTTLPTRIRAWGLHQGSTDRLFVGKGLVSIVVFDGRQDSPTFGWVNEFRVSERNPGLLVIPPNLYHGWKNIGVDEAYIINMPSSQYEHEHPDALDLPYESAEAERVVPWRWW
jgi:dTDP-4-dehydrorhamnose 3,5-epimerase